MEKVENWRYLCSDIFGTSIKDENSLLGALRKVFFLDFYFLFSKYYIELISLYSIVTLQMSLANNSIEIQVQQTVEKSLYICNKSCGSEVEDFCVSCFSDFQNQEFLTCSICKDW